MKISLVHTYLDTFKIDPFNITLFKRWQERLFSAIDVVNFRHILIDTKLENDYEFLPIYEIGNKQVRHVILSSLTNDLFDFYCQYKIAKDIWDVMNKKYILEDVGT